MPPRIAVSDDEVSEEVSDIGGDSNGEEFKDEQDEMDDVNDDIDEADFTPEQPVRVRPTRNRRDSRNGRDSRKRQLAMFGEDDGESEDAVAEEEEEQQPAKKKVSIKLKIPKRRNTQENDDDEDNDQYRPDQTKMTERQRARLAEEGNGTRRNDDSTFQEMDEQLLALNRKTAKKQETAEELALRKAENARRRADYKTKQLEEEKRDTLNKLLKRRATKTKENEDDEVLDSKSTTLKPRRPITVHPALFSWRCGLNGSLLGFNGDT